MRHDPIARRRGVTLVETVTAVLVLSIAIPPMLWAIKSGHEQRINPMLASRARWLAVERLEEVIADRHSETRGWSHIVAGSYPREAPVTGASGFTREVTLQETGADLVSPGTGYMIVTVTVTWVDVGSTSRSLSISSVVTEYDA